MTLEILNFHGFSSAELHRIVESEHHFVGVSKMVPPCKLGMNTEARELEAKIAENVVELLEA
jgi:hypothetical protein